MSEPLKPADLSAYLAQPSEAEREFLRLFGTSEKLVIFDIGACEGEDSVRYARRFAHSRIFAFEPLPANQELVRKNLAHYDVRNVHLAPVALSDSAGESTFFVSSGRPPGEFAGPDWNYGNKSSSLLPPAAPEPMHGWIRFRETIPVRTETLDAFCAANGLSRISFMQLDVQGAELRVLAGARAMLPRTTAVWLEVSTRQHYQDQPLAREVERFMRSQGFALGFTNYLGDAIGEGDHLYLNLRHPRTWLYLAAAAARRTILRARRLAGSIRKHPNSS